MSPRPISGVGLGLRVEFVDALLASDRRGPDFLEFFPQSWDTLTRVGRGPVAEALERWPVTIHSTFADLGGRSQLSGEYLDLVRRRAEAWGAPFWSDHLCWSKAADAHLFELLPLPFTSEAARHFARRAREARDRTGVPLALENVSQYVLMRGDLDEAGFVGAVLELSDAGLMLDVNNVVVNCANHGGDPREFIDRMPLDRVWQIHVAGHTVLPHVVLDTHTGPTPEAVLDLYRYTLRRAGRMIPTILEWDTDIPTDERILDEVDRVRAAAEAALADEEAA